MVTANSSKRLLVEGSSDLHVIIHLLLRHGIEPNFWIGTSKDIPHSEIRSMAKSTCPGARRWEFWRMPMMTLRVDGRPFRDGSQTPVALSRKTLARTGSVFPGPRGMQVGVWLMPDNRSSGELEDFVHDLIPATDPVLPRAKCYIDEIPKRIGSSITASSPGPMFMPGWQRARNLGPWARPSRPAIFCAMQEPPLHLSTGCASCSSYDPSLVVPHVAS